MTKPTLTETDYAWAANELKCEIASIKAVAEVESGVSGFLKTGEPAILFERHWFHRLLRNSKKQIPNDPDIASMKSGGYKGGILEHHRLQKAVKYDREIAIQAASWGKFQIMGFHWKGLGYKSVQEFVNAMYKSESDHLDAFVRFIKADSRLLKAIREKDWASFANAYNGPAYHKNQYDIKMRNAYYRYYR